MHSTENRQRSWLFSHIARYPYWYASLFMHLLILWLLYYCFPDLLTANPIDSRAQEQQIAASLEQTSHLQMQKRLEDMAKIKALLKQSLGENSSEPIDAETADRLQHATAQEMLTEAKKLSAAITEIKDSAKAKELAALLNIPEAEALTKIKQAEPPTSTSSTIPEHSTATDMDAVELAPLLEKLTQEAKDALIERQQQLAKEQQGVQLAHSSDEKKSQEADVKGTLADGSQEEGEGKGAGKNKGADGFANGTGHDKGSGSNPEESLNSSGSATEKAQRNIAAYLHGDLPLPTGDDKAGSTVFNQGSGRIPSLDGGSLHKRDGLVLGAGGEFSNRFYLNRWHIIGPFDGGSQWGFSTRKYPPEQAVDFTAVYAGKDDRLLRWTYYHSDQYPLVPPDFQENAVYYGYTELIVDKDSDLWVWIGADDNARIWLNDYVVYEGGNLNKGWYFDEVYSGSSEHRKNWNFTEAKQLMHFKKGRNKIMFRLFNASKRGYFSMVLSK